MTKLATDKAPLPLRPMETPRGGPAVFATVPACYVLVGIIGVALIRFGDVTAAGGELSFDRAVFTVVNALTLTGFQQDVGLNLSHTGRPAGVLLLLALTLAGTLLTLAAGSMAVVRIVRLPYSDQQVVLAAITATALFVLAGATALADRGPLQALFDAASAFGNSGLYAGRLPTVTAWQTHAVLLPLAFVGGLGLPVLMEGFDRALGRLGRLSTHARTVLAASAAVYVVGFLAVLLLQIGGHASAPGSFGMADWRYLLSSASAAAINTRSAGMPLEYVQGFERAAQWLLVALMAVGAAPAGTAGGLKVTTLVRLGTGVRDALRGDATGRGFGIAAVWLGSYFALVALGFLTLLATEPGAPADRLLFLCVSAASNVGLSHDPIAVVGPGLYALSALMLVGRVTPLLVLWWMARTTCGEDLAIG